jgi:hypothetical protein
MIITFMLNFGKKKIKKYGVDGGGSVVVTTDW